MTGEELARAFERFYQRGDGYVLGANGELYTSDLAEKWEKTRGKAPGYFTVDCRKWIGRHVADCSGGIVAAMREENPSYGDRTANTFKRQFVKSGTVDALPEIRGLALWKPGHIGIYVGGGYAVEFRGVNYGCVKTVVKGRGWSHWGEIRDVDYSPAGQAGAGKPGGFPQRLAVATENDPLMLRKGAGTGFESMTKMPRGVKVYGLDEQNGWIDVLFDDGDKVWRGWASGKYLK